MFILAILLISLNIFGQSNTLPNWNYELYKSTERPFRWTLLSNKPIKIETKLYLNNSNNTFKYNHTVYGLNYSPSLFYSNSKLAPLDEINDSGSYTKSLDLLTLGFKDTNLIYKIRENQLVYPSNKQYKNLKYQFPHRTGFAFCYGSYGLALAFNVDYFLVKGKNVFFSLNADAFFNNFAIGTSIGYQYKSFITQLEIDGVSLHNSFNIQVNPKIGFEANGLFLKVGPCIIPNYENKNNTSGSKDTYNPFKIECGYYFKLDSKYLNEL